ncbi:MAG: flagellar motor protein MotB [Thiomicrorhabdus chilensis]|uniref:OmpA/MotB family protein n=1 Tax=Thiomicrorhabdus chilensis TaxID=63656 RepID=UPI00299EA58F|nr:flagellar motor protein MotB [Thiomicrorhabdus chilensis]MDX1348368.1 flagellar motor protein MotB [Thiomicrorhabdus chilensis]
MAKKQAGSSWLMTFADLMSLLMAVFVLLFAMSTLEIPKYRSAVESLREALDGSPLSAEQLLFFDSVDQQDPVKQDYPSVVEKDLVPLYEKLIKRFPDGQQGASINVEYNQVDDEIKVTFPEEIAFDPGRAELKPEFSDLLLNFEGFYREDVLVRAMGHTDKLPVVGGRFNSNWELSSARAANVILELVSQGLILPEQAEAIGLADTQPLSNGNLPADLAKNRRVEVLIKPLSKAER